MHIRLTLSNTLREQLLLQLHQAYRRGHLRLLKRIHAFLYVSEGKPVSEVMAILQLSQQSVYNYVKAFILHGLDSLHYQRPSGRPPKLTKSQKQELCAVIDQGPEAAGYDCGCWTTALLQDVILTRFGVEYNPHYLAELLGTLGYSYQKARFVSDHLAEVAAEQATWLTQTWPTLLARAQAQGAMILFGDECSFAQWGSLSYTWAKRCQQPEVKTSGKRKAYKVMGFIDYFSGAFFYQAQTAKFTSEAYQTFLCHILADTTTPLFIIQDGARYHTSAAMRAFFAAHADRLTVFQLPRYSPDFNPIEYLWRKLKKQATHLRYFPTFEALTTTVDAKLQALTGLPDEIKSLMGKYCATLGQEAASA